MAKAEKEKKEKKEKAPKAARTPSAYNTYMKDEIARVKKDNPGMGHREAFKVAASHVRFLIPSLFSLCFT